MNSSNRRKQKRIRLDKSAKISVQIFPLVPFIGEAMEANLVDLSAGGLAFSLIEGEARELKKGKKIRVHFRLPGKPLMECLGTVTHQAAMKNGRLLFGIRFHQVPSAIVKELNRMAEDNDHCDRRNQLGPTPFCDPNCAFFNLCKKPIRIVDDVNLPTDQIEVALEHLEKIRLPV